MEGEITPEEAETHPQRSILTRALGVDRTIQVDEGDIETFRRPDPAVHGRAQRHGPRGGRSREILLDDPGSAGGRREARQGREPRRRHRQHHGRDHRFEDDGGGPGATKQSAIAEQPTMERPIPPAAPPNRSDITIVGAPIPDAAARGPGVIVAARRADVSHGAADAGARTPRRTSVVPPRREEGGDLDRRDARDRRARRCWASRLYLDSQWFVGVSNGRVAIFRGVPAEVGGFELHSVVVETSIPAERRRVHRVLPRTPRRHHGGRPRPSAEAIVESIREDVARFERLHPVSRGGGAEEPHVARALGRVHDPGADPVGRRVRASSGSASAVSSRPPSRCT